MSLIFALIISLLSFAGTQQQDIRYHNISMQDGLRSNAVRNIVQDKFGFVWLGTDNGLCRYDGTSVHYYTILQQGTDQYISALQNTENGLLVGTAHGTVNVVSEKGKGAKFIITLSDVINEKTDKETVTCESISQEDTNADSYQSDELDKNTQSNISESVPTMLIVDDDPDMLAFISSNFAKSYTLFTAQNGVEALEILHKKTVSLIVSDWMMPEMDGAELCRRIRKDYTISHIPFIMLTAKTDNDSKAESMDCGADAYIEKPFSMKYLEACIRNMIEMRHLLMQKFSSLPSEPISRIANTTVDDEFLTRMNAIIEDNISNTELNVAFLASELGISRSGLFAKIKALADVTPNEMIQVIRLRRAAVLLQQNKYRINEVCYMVGFNSPSYFTKCFQKQFGTKPGEHLA